ncbi:hypothetical protein KTS45_10535 [Halomicroarcula limicola]|uniref:Uncharacterized protein n=1 Tax=Haloarcula limicola TaxID=1429915 RepID=A0A8J7YB51_9EURY|nr:hypothetical protein [Halomicroarcula limicola]MBV0924634.1 hypothetical protein [Halomicroarcula limicola]
MGDESEPVYDGALRGGGRITVTDDWILADRPDEESVAVPLSGVVDVTLQDVDWFLVAMSLGLVGFGLASVGRNLAFAAFFVVAGLLSTALTYRKRGALRIGVSGETQPLKLFPADPQACYDALESVLGDS